MATYRQRAWEIAVGQHGYITTAQAEEEGIPAIELVKLAARGRLHHVARGIYRFDELPPSKFDQYYEAVLRVGDGAFLVGDAVLALHDLALVNPRKIRVGVRLRRRRALPDWLKTVRISADVEVIEVEGIPTTTVAQAFRDARAYVMTERLIEALPEAVREGLVDEREARALKRELEAIPQ